MKAGCWVLLASVGLSCVCPVPFAAAQPAVAPAKPDGGKVLEKARAALSKVNALSYDAVVAGEGGLQTPKVSAQVSMAKAEAGGWRIYTRGTSGESAFEVACDGVQARSVREAEKAVYEKSIRNPEDRTELMVFFSGQSAKHPVAWELISGEPLKATASTLEGEETVAGEPCDVVKIPAPAGATEGVSDADYGTVVYVSKRDGLPRRIARKVNAGSEQLRVLTLENLKINGESIGAPYTLGVPDGFAVRQADATKKKRAAGGGPREPGQGMGVVNVGDMAPAFALKDVNGKEHTLASYRGKVVVVDFWATWCFWCIKGMPAVQAVHEKFKGKDVVVLGIGYNENGDGAAFMREKKYTYGLLLNGEVLKDAYGIKGIPAMFIIGKDGTIAWRADGFSPDHEKHMTGVIEAELKK